MDPSKAGPREVRVLVVEDDDDARAATLSVLEGVFGVRAVGARDGEDALALLPRIRPDLILCDLQMPRLDGFGFVRRLRADPRFHRILTIAVSGLGRPIDLAATHAAGFDGHVVKPMTTEILARLLERARVARDAGAPPQGIA